MNQIQRPPPFPPPFFPSEEDGHDTGAQILPLGETVKTTLSLARAPVLTLATGQTAFGRYLGEPKRGHGCGEQCDDTAENRNSSQFVKIQTRTYLTA